MNIGTANSNTFTAENIEYFSDQVINLLLVNDAHGYPSSFASRTPLQKLAIEEISKIIGALSRQQWGNLRQRSGILPSGRSLLGTLVDPLGLFSESPLVSADPYDEKVIDSTTRLLVLLQKEVEKMIPKGSSMQSLITSRDSIQILNSLSRKLWDRRRELAVFGTGIVAQVIENSITRLDGNGRDRSPRSMIRGRGQQDFDRVFNNKVEMPDVVPMRKRGTSANQSESERLKSSRID